MSRSAKIRAAALALTVGLLLIVAPGSAAAATGPEWDVTSVANSSAEVGSTHVFSIRVSNKGETDTVPGACPGPDCQTLTVTLPDGLIATEVIVIQDWNCSIVDPHQAECTLAQPEERLFRGPASGQAVLVTEVASTAAGVETIELTASGGGASPVTVQDPTEIGPNRPFGFDAFDVSIRNQATASTAATHPDGIDTTIDFNRGTVPIFGALRPAAPFRDVEVELPPGLLGNPTIAATCTAAQLSNSGQYNALPFCPPESQVGLVTIEYKFRQVGQIALSTRQYSPASVYNMVPPPGVAARFGFQVVGTVITIDAKVRGGGDYGVTVGSMKIPEALAIIGTRFDFWGVPAAAAHDALRGCPGEESPAVREKGHLSCTSDAEELPFLRNPSSCVDAGGSLAVNARANSWKELSVWRGTSTAMPGMEGCESVPFDPAISVAPTTNAADSPSGLEVDLTVPQGAMRDPAATAQSDLKAATVTLPEGMTVNPSGANGLAACSSSQIGLLGTNFPAPAPIRFTNEAPNCPDGSKIGAVSIQTPLLDHSIAADVYLATQQDNPFGSVLAMYIAGRDAASGVVLKLPGRITTDPSTGRLTTSFDNNPQLPFSSLHLELFGGPRAPLRTPPNCGTHTVGAELTPWARPGSAVPLSSSFQISSGPGGSPCPAGGFDPKLQAGTANPLSMAFSPFSLRLTREDGSRELTGLQLSLPPGLLAKLAGIPYCPDATLAGISGALGTGAAQIATPSCPAASQVGTVTVGAGAGPTPFYTASGKAYLAGPYKGAPLSLAVVTPAVAGPFDLGSVMVRNALHVDPATAKVTAVSDPFPTILHGIPLDLRDVQVNLDRPSFTLNPTSCDPMAIDAAIAGAGGASAQRSERFQVAGCERLAFKPKLSLRLKGGTKRAQFPALRATLRMPAGNANIAKASVAMPHALFLAQQHIKTVCTRVQFAADACPTKSVYGYAKAWSPLLDQPLEGPVYLRSSSNPLPDLVAALRGQIEIDLAGRIDSKGGGIRTTFDLVPDAPVTKFVLSMKGARKGLLENSRDLCKAPARAIALFDGHNGKVKDLRPKLGVRCGKGKGKG